MVEFGRPNMRPRKETLASEGCAALRLYAGASYYDVCPASVFSDASMCDIVWDSTDAVLCAPELKMRMPL